MKRDTSSIGTYLETLAANLEALGPDEQDEVVTEVRAHLAEALIDAGNDEAIALAQFGSADALAMRILEERGVISGDSGLSQAPTWLRALALAADVALWLATLILLTGPLALLQFQGRPGLPTMMLAYAALGAVVVGSAWWWIRRWRRPSHSTLGMRLFGLRRIRLGTTTRVVRQRNLPGAPRMHRVWPVIAAALAMLLLWSVASSGARSSESQVRAQLQTAVGDAAGGVGMISDLYTTVIAGGTLEDIDGTYAPSARDAVAALIERHAAGKVDSYAVFNIELDDYDDRIRSGFNEPRTVVVLVTIYETAKGPNPRTASYRWRVACDWVKVDESTSEGTWLIRSAEVEME